MKKFLRSYVTTLKVSVFGVFLVRIFPHSGWIRRFTQSECGKIRTRKLQIRTLFIQCLRITFSRQMFQFYTPWKSQKARGDYFRRYRKETFGWIGFNLEFIKNIFTYYCKPLCNKIASFWNVCAIKFCTIFSWFSGLFNCIACKRLPGQILRNILFAGTLYLTY